MRYVAMLVALIASIGQIVPMLVLAVCLPACLYCTRYRIAWPVAIVLVVPIVVAAAVFCPFWMLAMVSNAYLLNEYATRGSIAENGLLLEGRRLGKPRLVAWEEIRTVGRKLTPPLGSRYTLTLGDGSELRVDSLPFESPSRALEEIRSRLTVPDGGG